MAASGRRGGRAITSASAGSKARATARVTAVTMFTHRICTGVSGRTRPKVTAASMTRPSAPLVGRMKRMALRRLS